MRTSLPPRRVTPNRPPTSIALHPIHPLVDALADRAAAVTDVRLKQLLHRTGCVLLDHALTPKKSCPNQR